MYANLLEHRAAQLDVDSGMLIHGNDLVPVIDAAATVSETGKNWAIALVNRHPTKEAACTIKLKGNLIDGTYPATLLVGDSTDAYNDLNHPERVVPERIQLPFKGGVVKLAPHSLTIVRLSPR
jgi:alpha-N-arabinofuranosidase